MTIYIVFYHHTPLIPKVLDSIWIDKGLVWEYTQKKTVETSINYFIEEHKTQDFGSKRFIKKYSKRNNLTVDIDEKDYLAGFNDGFDCGRTQFPKRIQIRQPETAPIAFKWHNIDTGHCYVDYIPHMNQDEKDGYTKFPLYTLSGILKT